jgi:hypothetical protein
MGELQLARRFEKSYILALRDQDRLDGKHASELATDANIASTPEALRQFILDVLQAPLPRACRQLGIFRIHKRDLL